MSEKLNLENLSFREVLALACEPPKQSFTEYVREKNKPQQSYPNKPLKTTNDIQYTQGELIGMLYRLKGLNPEYFYSIDISWGKIRMQGRNGLGTIDYLKKLGFVIIPDNQFIRLERHPFVIVLT